MQINNEDKFSTNSMTKIRVNKLDSYCIFFTYSKIKVVKKSDESIKILNSGDIIKNKYFILNTL